MDHYLARGVRPGAPGVHKLPSWFAVAYVLMLMQPSSASIERFFATVKANTSAQQNGESHETLAVRCMCLYNNG